MTKRITLLLMFALLASCGFKLRGFAEMPSWLRNVAIVVQEAHQDLVPVLRDQLQAYGIQVVPDPIAADFLLVLEKDMLGQQITSVSASTTPRQYQLVYTLEYSLIEKKNKKPVGTSGKVIVMRQFTMNNDRVLGSDYESGIIISEMHREASMKIMNRISKK